MTLLDKAKANLATRNIKTHSTDPEFNELVAAFLQRDIRLTDFCAAIGVQQSSTSIAYARIANACIAMCASGELTIKLK